MKKGITKFVMIVPTSMVHSAAAKNASQCAKGGVAEANGVHIVHVKCGCPLWKNGSFKVFGDALGGVRHKSLKVC